MLVAMHNVADAAYTLTAVTPLSDKGDGTKWQNGHDTVYQLRGIDTVTGEIGQLDIKGEALAYLCLTVLVSSEEFHEDGFDLNDRTTRIGAAYSMLQESSMRRFMP